MPTIMETINRGFSLLFEQTAEDMTWTSDNGWSDGGGGTGNILNYQQRALVTKSGNSINGFEAMAISAFFAGARMIAEDIAKLDINIFTRDAQGNKIKINRQHPLYRVISLSPDGRQTSQEFWETIILWTLMWGNGYAIIDRDNGETRSLQLVKPTRVTIEKNRGVITYLVTSDPLDSTGQTSKRYTDMEMFHLRGVGDEEGGYPVANFARESLGITLAAQTLQSNMFSNGMNPSGFLMMEEIMKEDHKKGMEKEWARKYSGVNNAGKAMILDGGVKYENQSFDAGSAELLSTRKFQTEEMARWLRIPLHKVGIQEANATFNNVEEENLKYAGETLGSWMQRIVNNIDRKLLLFDPNVFVEYDPRPLTMSDSSSRAKYWSDLIDSGIAVPNDGASDLNLKTYPAGNKHYITQNVKDVETVDIELEIMKKDLEAKDDPPPPTDDDPADPDEEENNDTGLQDADVEENAKNTKVEHVFDLTNDLLKSFQRLVTSPLQIVVNREISHYSELEQTKKKLGDAFILDELKQEHFENKIRANYIENLEPWLNYLKMEIPDNFIDKWVDFREEGWQEEKAMMMANDLIKHYLQISNFPQGLYELESPNGHKTTVQIDSRGVISELQT